MSNERKNQEEDRLVAEAYRELARERAPDRLNEKVLRLAAQAGRSRYGLARTWMRPAAWVATIGLSLAIVLELTRLPQIEPELAGVSSSDEWAMAGARDNDEAAAVEQQNDAPAAEVDNSEAKRQFAPKDMAVLREAENRARLQAGPDQAGQAGAVAKRLDVDVDVAVAVAVEDDIASADEVLVDEVLVDENRAAPSVEAFSASRSRAAKVEKSALAGRLSCPAEARETAEAWYACIKALRNEGAADVADTEYKEFERKFPDFVDLDADR